MSGDRPPIPRPLARAVRVEAGHRCAIPTCRQTSGLQIHHITDWSKVKEHTFDNLILICAVCHARATNGEIDRLAMVQYKANLGVLSSRYGEFERRFLEMISTANAEPGTDLLIVLPFGRDIDLWYLLRDGLIVKVPQHEVTASMGGGVTMMGQPSHEGFRLTETGVAFVKNLVAAEPVD